MHGELPKQALAPTQPVKRGNRRVFVIGLIVVVVAAAAVYHFTGSTNTQQRRSRFGGENGPVPVLVAPAAKADVPVYLDAVGTTKALNTVLVKAQVDGKLIEVAFKEGQDVKRGDVLARIDPTTYQAALDQAIAKKAQDEALLANAKNDLARYEQLAATNAINRQQADTQKSLVAQYVAQIQSDQGAIESAQATLAYTTIRSPLDGRTGIRAVDEGNIIRAADTTGVVTLTQLQPISILFNLPQQEITRVNSTFAKGPLTVDALRSDNDEVIDSGTLSVVDNQVDSTTGTVRLKAEFPNKTLQLWPGQFVNIRLLIDTLKQVVTIPTGAVQRGPTGTFVYVVKDDNAVSMRTITVQKQDENQTVVSKGVEAGERVVTTGFARLTDNAKITISSGDGTAAPAAPRQRGPRSPGEKGERRRGGGDASPNALQGAAPGTAPGTTPSAPPAATK
ncbi:MAG TPA: efflux RND transporter periplasmic adaptor subunit [Pseudolabrys sp.]